jgi:hypothetical protein
MRKAIAVSFFLFCLLLSFTVAMFGLCLMGTVGALVWGGTAGVLTLPCAFDVIEAAWKQ